MGYLTPEEQQLILDFYFRCGTPEDIERGRDLIASNPEAARLYAGFEETLTELDALKYEPCPENLAELTIARLRVAASARTAPNGRLTELIYQETQKTEFTISPTSEKSLRAVKPMRRWGFEALALAASIILIASVLAPSLSAMRQHSRQIACQNQLRQIGQAMAAFATDNTHRLAQLRVESGAPWWKIGYQGPENYSNTRYVWQMVKQGYIAPTTFVCSSCAGCPSLWRDVAVSQLNDFPSPRHISYSFILLCNKNPIPLRRPAKRILASDANPLFKSVRIDSAMYEKLNEFQKILLNEQLRQVMSPNHSGRGQNVLFGDGSSQFLTTRLMGQDDIFTIRDITVYTGTETPCDPSDTFLAP